MIFKLIIQWIFLLIAFNLCSAEYDVPPAKVEVFYPKGFRVSIPGKKCYKVYQCCCLLRILSIIASK